MSWRTLGLSFFVCLMEPGIPGAAVRRQGSGPDEPRAEGLQKGLGSLRDTEEADSWRDSSGEGGAPGRRALGRRAPGGDSSLRTARYSLPLQGPFPLLPTHSRSALRGPQGGPRLLGVGVLTGRGGTPRWAGLGVLPGRGGASPTPGTARGRGGGGAAAPVTSLRPPPPRRLLFPFPN